MSTRLEGHLLRKEVAEKLASIRAHMLEAPPLPSDAEDAEVKKASQEDLARLLGISQSETSRLLRGACAPHPETLKRINLLYATSRCLRWGAAEFHPICALARQGESHA